MAHTSERARQPSVARIFADAAHRIGPPVASKWYVEAHLVTARGQSPRHIVAYADKHLKLEFAGMPAIALGMFNRVGV